MKHVKRFFLLLLLAFLAVFYFQNSGAVGEMFTKVFLLRLDLLVFDQFGPVGVYNAGLMAAAFVLGALSVFLLGFLRKSSSRSELKRSRETVGKLERKVEELEKSLLEQKVERLSEKAPESGGGRNPFQPPK